MENTIEKDRFNRLATHPLQAYEWGEFRKKTGIAVVQEIIDETAIQITIHKIPYLPFTIGYFPKGTTPTKPVIEKLKEIGKKHNCIFIQLEPNVENNRHSELVSESPLKGMLNKVEDPPRRVQHDKLYPSFHPLFTKYTFQLDLTKSEEELLKNMHPKTRYNIRVAQKKGVTVTLDNSQEAFEQYLKLTEETTNRQGFYAHTKRYHELMWETLKNTNSNHKPDDFNYLSARLLTATYEGKILVAWIVFVFHDTLYYPYGASSNENREVMASNLMMWETIRFGKKLGLTKFDMWGALGPSPDAKDPWYGFHRFKQGYGPELLEFAGSFDLVINPLLYQGYKVADKLRWLYLKAKKT